MLTLASDLSLHVVVMPPFLSARGITTLLKKETGQTKVLRVLCHFIQAQKGQFNFWMTRIASLLSFLVSKGSCK